MPDRVDSPWARQPVGTLFSLDTTSCIPARTPTELFVHHSLPAWDATGGPVVESGAAIESNKFLVTQPSVLVSKLNPRKPRVVVVTSPLGDLPRCASTEFMVYVPRTPDVCLAFYSRVFASGEFQNRLERVATGTTNSHVRVRPSETLLWNVPVPPLPEQRRIAEILDTVDAALQQTEALIAKLRQARAGLLHDLLTRGVDEHGQLRDPQAHPEHFKDSPLGRVPREWNIEFLRDVCIRLTDGAHTAVRTSSSGTVPFLYVSCVRDGSIRWDQAAQIDMVTFESISQGKEPRAGDILYTAVGSYGHAAVVPDNRQFSFQRHIAILRPNDARLNPRFLGEWLNSAWCRLYADRVALGNAQKTLTLAALSTYPIPVPDRSEQEQITNRLTSFNEQIQVEALYYDKLRKLRQGLTDDLLTGTTRATDELGVHNG